MTLYSTRSRTLTAMSASSVAKAMLAAALAALVLLGVVACGSDGAETEEAETSAEMAPGFSLPSAFGGRVGLTQLLDDNEAVVIVFYRGFF